MLNVGMKARFVIISNRGYWKGNNHWTKSLNEAALLFKRYSNMDKK